jgi:iron complex outermembrane receptor protein
MMSAALGLGAPLIVAPFAPAAAQTAQTHDFNIPSQPLTRALRDFADQSGLQLAYKTSVATGAMSPAIHGAMTADQALSQLLAGSPLQYRFSGSGTIVIGAASAAAGAGSVPGSIPLDVIDVQGTGETARGPVNGYVAQRSATASKTDTPIIETPRTVTVITADQIAAQQAQSVRDTMRYAPGAYYNDDADFRFEQVNARGFILDEYLDGLKLLSGTWSVPRVDPYFLERAEVLEGPASALYGQASPGGVLDMISKRPTDTPLHEIEVTTGSYSLAQTAFDFSGPVNNDNTLLYRVTGIARTSDSQVDYLGKQRIAIAPSFTWRPDASTSLTVTTSYLYDPKAGFWDFLPLQGTVLPNVYGKIPRDLYVGDPSFEHYEFQQAMAGYEFEHHFDETWTVRQNFRFTHIDLNYAEVQGYQLESDQRTLERYAYTADESLNTINVDSQAEAKFKTGPVAHTALFGIDYQYLNWDDFTRYGNAPSLDILYPNYNQFIPMPPVFQDAHQVQNQLGLYAQDQIRFDRFVFTLGGREDWANTNTDNYLTKTTAEQGEQAFTWHAGLLYHFDSGIAPYISYATSFDPTSGTDAQGNAFKPTTGQQYEAGIKYQPPGWKALLTASVFDLTENNVLTPDPNNTNYDVQTGEVRTRGVELSAVASLTDSLNIRASYTHLNNEILKANDGTEGNELADTPSNFGALWADYTIQSGAFAGLGFGGGARFVGPSYTTNANTLSTPGYSLFDAALHYDFGKLNPKLKGLTAKINATNILDKVYIPYCNNLGCWYGEGRTVYATLAYKW